MRAHLRSLPSTATRLNNGQVLVAGGLGSSGTLASAELTLPETAITDAPKSPTLQTTATFKFSANDANATFECRLDEAAFSPCTSPAVFFPLAGGTHTFQVRARDGLGNIDFTPARHSWVIDLEAPNTWIDSVPADPNQDRATFVFRSSESGSSFQCSLDEEDFSPCPSTMTYTYLEEGHHSFRVQARDAVGNLDLSPDSYEWTIDLTPIETRITKGPIGFSNHTTVSFAFESKGGSQFECSLNGADYRQCDISMTYVDLADGKYTLRVRAVDGQGNKDDTPEERRWTVDTVPPDTRIVEKPESETHDRNALFTFVSKDKDATFECSLDQEPFVECPAVYTRTELDSSPRCPSPLPAAGITAWAVRLALRSGRVPGPGRFCCSFCCVGHQGTAVSTEPSTLRWSFFG